MSKTVVRLAVLGVVALAVLWVIRGYNTMVNMEENVEAAWSHVENEYQRRMDAVPQFVGAVRGAAKHEESTMTGVMEARAKASQITIDPSNVTPDQLAAFQNAQGELSQALGRLMAVSEAYPELKANQNFLTLQSQLEGSENRCTVARDAFNEAAKIFNKQIRVFPNNVIANLLGFEKKPYFEAEAGANKAPVVEF